MARINNRTKKTKPSKQSRTRRRHFLQNQKLADRREYVAKEKEANETIDSLRIELDEARRALQEMRTAREEDKAFYQKRHKEIVTKREAEWKECWKRREEAIKKGCREEKEREKQNILEDRAQLLAERDQLKLEVEELKRKFLGYRA